MANILPLILLGRFFVAFISKNDRSKTLNIFILIAYCKHENKRIDGSNYFIGLSKELKNLKNPFRSEYLCNKFINCDCIFY